MSRVLVTVALGMVILGGLAERCSAELITGNTFDVTNVSGGTIVGGSGFQYNVSNDLVGGNTAGQSRFSTAGGTGYNFYIGFQDNVNNVDNRLGAIGAGGNYGAKGLTSYFNGGLGLTAAPTITALPAGFTFGGFTTTEAAPVGGMILNTWTADRWSVNSTNATIGSGAKVAYEISIQAPAAVPEPSTFALLGLGMVGSAGFRRWKRRRQTAESV